MLFGSCGTTKTDPSAKYKINYLDEYVLTSDEKFKGNVIGGLSGIDFNGSEFVLISDKSKAPEIYTAEIEIKDKSIKSIRFKDVAKLRCEYIEAFDTESIRFLTDNSGFLVTTEGNINALVKPRIIEVDTSGKCNKNYDLPQQFEFDEKSGVRQNGVFEGSTIDADKKGFWVVNEIPLRTDGKKPKLINTNSPVRLTHYTFNKEAPDYQLSYDLERLIKIPFLPFGLNGVTEILQVDQNHILVLERSFSAGHKSKGNRVKLFLVNISKEKNVLEYNSLKKQKSSNLEKVLVFDSKTIKNQLKYKFIDNIEGISFGPELSNGNKSLILVSDNNFNALGEQLNQFILLELVKPDSL